MKKVLFIANTSLHIKLCHIPYLKMFHDNGYIVHVATNSINDELPCDKQIVLSLKRYPFSLINFKAIKEIRKLVKEEKYDVISCHTPMGGFLGRVSVIGTNYHPLIFYTAHGFHFYKGCKLINYLLYYNIELFLSKYTTCILTMNQEDYLRSKKFKCPTYLINGIGYDPNRLKSENMASFDSYFVVTYVAEISKRKNQINLIKKLNKIDLEKEHIMVLLIGNSLIKNLSKYLKSPNIKHIPFTDNIGYYLKRSDLVISASTQEGLPLNIIEGMSLNKMIIATNIRGNRDLINANNGILVDDLDSLVREIIKYKNKKKKKIIKNDTSKYRIDKVIIEVKNIYNKYLKEKLK